jgi:hypothetical protein
LLLKILKSTGKLKQGRADLYIPNLIIQPGAYSFKLTVTVIDRLSSENSTKEIMLSVVDCEFVIEQPTFSFEPRKRNTLNVS